MPKAEAKPELGIVRPPIDKKVEAMAIA